MVYVIAEIGNNHNGSVKKCLELIDAASETGVDAIKIQSFTGLDICTPTLETADYPDWDTKGFKYWFEFADSIALPLEAHQEVIDYTKSKNLDFITTPVSPKIVNFLETLSGINAYKLASMDLNNLELISSLSKTTKPIILSTGMGSLNEISGAKSAFQDNDISILHCVSDYPLDPINASLQNIKILSNTYPNIKIGFSDHSLGKELAISAVTLGAKIIEKHFTLDRDDKDSAEHHFSMLPDEFSQMVKWIRVIESNLSTSNWKRSKNEEKGKIQFRRSLHYVRDLNVGHKIGINDLAFLRPGNGISYDLLDRVLNKSLKKPIKEYSPCKLEDFE